MSVDEIQGKWGKSEREGTCESDAERMKWNGKQSRWRGGGGGGREESPSIKSCFGLSLAAARVPSGHGLCMCVCACVGHSLSPTFSVALNHPDASAHWRDQPITALYSQHLHYDSHVAAHKGRLQGVDEGGICPCPNKNMKAPEEFICTGSQPCLWQGRVLFLQQQVIFTPTCKYDYELWVHTTTSSLDQIKMKIFKCRIITSE